MADTKKAIWECLHQEYMPAPHEEGWGTIAHRFNQLWNLPNCVGEIDGKHPSSFQVLDLPTSTTNHAIHLCSWLVMRMGFLQLST
jgi:hypothetical protein